MAKNLIVDYIKSACIAANAGELDPVKVALIKSKEELYKCKHLVPHYHDYFEFIDLGIKEAESYGIQCNGIYALAILRGLIFQIMGLACDEIVRLREQGREYYIFKKEEIEFIGNNYEIRATQKNLINEG